MLSRANTDLNNTALSLVSIQRNRQKISYDKLSWIIVFCCICDIQETLRAELMTSYRLYKIKHVPSNIPPMVSRLKQMLTVLPVSSAECERGFSAMNRQQTKDRNRLQPMTVRYILLTWLATLLKLSIDIWFQGRIWCFSCMINI